MAKRSFSPSDVPEKGDDYHGGCRFIRTKPDIGEQGIKSVNIEIDFDEALRLAAAIQSAVLRLNRYNRSSSKGKLMGLCLSLKSSSRAISVIEQPVKVAEAE